METMYYIGLDVHKKTISYCVKDGGGGIYAEGSIPATRLTLDMWMKTLPGPWTVAMEATIFTAWTYDHLKPHAAAVKVAHPLMLRAIAAAKKKNDRIAGSWRRAAIFLDQEGHQLLRTVWRGEKFGQYHHAHATLETTQQTSAGGAD